MAGKRMGHQACASSGALADVAGQLRAAVRGQVSDDRRRRAEYASDAGNYRVLPQVVVEPLDVEDVLVTLAVSRESGVPVTSRGGGTSVAGNAIGTGIVIDFSRHLNEVLGVDLEARTAVVQPGVVLADLQERLLPAGLRFGPDPSTHARATFGGMIGNNACGAHTIAYGRTADNVENLDIIDGLGRCISTAGGSQQIPGLNPLVDSRLGVIREELGTFGRQISGYSLEHLLPERGRNLTRALVGSEGTLGVLLGATVKLVPISAARILVVLGFADMATAADAVPALLAHSPLALEGLDARLVDVVRRAKGSSAVPALPRGGGWLMVEVGGDSEAQARSSAASLVRDSDAIDAMVLPTGANATAMWRIREDGAGLAGRTPAGTQAWPGWEDAAVPPARLGAYLREFESLMQSYGVTGMPYGHFGDGCVHVRIDLPLTGGADLFRRFILDSAHLVVKFGGSCSGEHGDGRARSELLPIMYSAQAIELFSGIKDLFDPDDLLNPGIVVRPNPIDTDLRRPAALPIAAGGGFGFVHDDGDFTKAVHRCVGVGKCRADNTAAGGFMCPSYLASRDEKDVTRGRARVLQEVTNGSVIPDFRSAEVHESLDLCLSCKACASDCPAGVDMAQYKSEVLYRSYQGRLRPVSHYTLGRLPEWLSLLHRLPRIATTTLNALLRIRPLERLALRGAGMDPRRRAPKLAPVTFLQSWQRRKASAPVQETHDPVVLWADSFTDGMNPEVARAAVDVLTAAGYRVLVPDRAACCGLTWITTGQLDGARTRLRRLLEILGPYAAQGIPIVGLEPSCTAVLRSDLMNLFPGNPAAAQVAAATRTLAEQLTSRAGTERAWRMPDLSGLEVLVQPHCHHHSVMGFATDQKLLTDCGASVTTLAGCCGLAGNFGMEIGHYEMSVAVADNALLPGLRTMSQDSTVLADGFSCRTQIQQLTGIQSSTLAELLSRQLAGPVVPDTSTSGEPYGLADDHVDE